MLFKEISIHLKDATLFSLIMGTKGEPILILHGGPGLSMGYLLPQMAALSKAHTLIFYDQRGGGKSTGSINPETMRVKIFVEDLEEVRKQLGLERFSLLGHSWGALLAMHYALEYPEGINQIILLNSIPASTLRSYQLTPLDSSQEEMLEIKGTEEFKNGDPATVAYYYRLIFSKFFYNPAKADELNLSMSQKAALNSLKIWDLINRNELSKPYDLLGSLQHLSIPSLIIHGDSDQIPVAVSEDIHEAIPGSKYHLMRNCGHFPYIEKPDELFSIISQFLQLRPMA